MLARHLFNLPTMGNWHPFFEMDRLARQMDRMTDTMFGRPGAGLGMAKMFPAINITEDDEKYGKEYGGDPNIPYALFFCIGHHSSPPF